MHKREREPREKGEKIFAQILDQKGLKYICQPINIYYDCESYTPDFYVIEEKKFYEVVTTRQSYSYHQKFVKKIKEIYPFIQIEFVIPTGQKYKDTLGYAFKELSKAKLKLNQKGQTILYELLSKLKTENQTTWQQIASDLGISPSLMALINGAKTMSWSRLMRLAEYLKVDINILVDNLE